MRNAGSSSAFGISSVCRKEVPTLGVAHGTLHTLAVVKPDSNQAEDIVPVGFFVSSGPAVLEINLTKRGKERKKDVKSQIALFGFHR